MIRRILFFILLKKTILRNLGMKRSLVPVEEKRLILQSLYFFELHGSCFQRDLLLHGFTSSVSWASFFEMLSLLCWRKERTGLTDPIQSLTFIPSLCHCKGWTRKVREECCTKSFERATLVLHFFVFVNSFSVSFFSIETTRNHCSKESDSNFSFEESIEDCSLSMCLLKCSPLKQDMQEKRLLCMHLQRLLLGEMRKGHWSEKRISDNERESHVATFD
jgi:hypothetical protein